MKYQKAITWQRMDVCESVMNYDDFMKIMNDALEDYYNSDIYCERECYDDVGEDIRTTALIRYIKEVIEKGSKDSMWTILQAVLKGYKEVINSLSWITGFKVTSSCVDLYQLAADSCVSDDLEKTIGYIIFSDVFRKEEFSSVKKKIMSVIENKELMLKTQSSGKI